MLDTSLLSLVTLAPAVIVAPLAAAHAAEIELKGGDRCLNQRVADRVDDVVVHTAAVERVRVADNDAGKRPVALRQV